MSRIVVGVDAGAPAGRALERALWHARETGMPVVAVHAWRMPVWFGGFPTTGLEPFTWPEEARRVGQQVLDDQVDKALSLQPEPVPVVERELVEGDAGRALAMRATEDDLLVVGGRGPSTLSTLLGSVTSYVLHHARGTVMVVPETAPPAGRWHEVVVGIDGSPSSRAALRLAAAEARRDKARLVVVHAWLPSAFAGSFTGPSPDEHRALAWIAAEVNTVLPDLSGIDAKLLPVQGTASAALLDRAGADDLLVLGTRGRGGFASLLLGSVATQCAQHGTSAVAVVRG